MTSAEIEKLKELLEEIPAIRDYYRGSMFKTIETDINHLCNAVVALAAQQGRVEAAPINESAVAQESLAIDQVNTGHHKQGDTVSAAPPVQSEIPEEPRKWWFAPSGMYQALPTDDPHWTRYVLAEDFDALLVYARGMREDAKRYRWLRKNRGGIRGRDPVWAIIFNDELEKWIDIARSQPAAGEGGR